LGAKRKREGVVAETDAREKREGLGGKNIFTAHLSSRRTRRQTQHVTLNDVAKK